MNGQQSGKPQSGMGGSVMQGQPWGRPAGASDGGILGGTPYGPKPGYGSFGTLNPMSLPGWRGQGLGSQWQRPGGPQLAAGAGMQPPGMPGPNSAGIAPMGMPVGTPGVYNGGQPLDPSTGLPVPTEKPNTGAPGNSVGAPLNANSLAGPPGVAPPLSPLEELWRQFNYGSGAP